MNSINDKRELRKFGFAAGIILLVFSVWPLIRGGRVNTWLVAVSAIFVAAAVIFPFALLSIHKVMTKMGLVFGKINACVMLSVIFYVVITPIGLLKKIFSFGRRKSNTNTGIESHWHRRGTLDFGETMKRQF